MKKVVFIVLCFFALLNTTYALNLCTPSDEYKEYQKLKNKDHYEEPFYCKELIEKKDENIAVTFFKGFTTTIAASFTDHYYNAKDYGLINPSETQGSLGTCWAFSSTNAVEANAKKNNVGSYNFSEAHMVYSLLSAAYSDSAGKIGKYNTSNFDGGKITYAASYYFNNYGQLLENELPYSQSMPKITSSQYIKGRSMITLKDFTLSNLGNYSSCTNEELLSIKKQILDYGSVQGSMYMDDSLFKDNAKNYYISTLSNASIPNHGVSIIGWDDNIDKSNFNTSRNGAFIIKNSWGPNWSNDGLFYISYDDSFICKNIATFSGVSNTSFDNSYSASDMVGVPTFTFNSTFYISSKFDKKTSNTEALRRVSFPIGENLTYYVYLVSDNNYYNQSNYVLLTSGESNSYGIKSIDLDSINLFDDFTIVVKYVPRSETSIFTMCNNYDDTSLMSYSTNTNYYSTNGSTWKDLSSLTIGNETLKCEPNIYAYTNNISQITDGSISISSITTSNNKFIVSFVNNGINTSDITYLIKKNNTNVTSHFTISPNYQTNKITITPDGKISGNFTFIIRYSSKEVTTNFSLNETITPKDSSFIKINSTNINVNISNNYTLTYEKLLNALNINNTEITILNPSGNVVTSSTSAIGTNYKIKLNNNTYLIIVMGDINSDGKISALDYLEVKKHIMGSLITDIGKKTASDLDQNNKITALDYIAIKKIIMR